MPNRMTGDFFLQFTPHVGKCAPRTSEFISSFAAFGFGIDFAQAVVGRSIEVIECGADRSFGADEIIVVEETLGIGDKRNNSVDALGNKRQSYSFNAGDRGVELLGFYGVLDVRWLWPQQKDVAND